MNEFSDVLQRANLNVIEEFFKYGMHSMEEPSKKSYSERIQEAKRKANAFFEARYSDIDELDEISGYFNEQTAVFEEVYFEIGMILGAKIGFQICEKMKELGEK